MRRFRNRKQVHRARRAFQAMGPPEDLLQIRPRRSGLRLRDRREQRTDLLQVVAMLYLKRGEQFLANILHRRLNPVSFHGLRQLR